MRGEAIDVVVIGAGMAGLGAARVLADAGVNVHVVEAKAWIGGRTYTSHLWPDLPIDIGASWIHGTDGNPVTQLATSLGLKVTPTTYDRSVTYDASGRQIDFIEPAHSALRLMDRARERVEDAEHDVSVQAAVEASPEWKQLSEFDRRVARLAINTRIEHEYAGDWSQLSAWHFDDGEDFPGDEAVVTPGYGAIIDHLADGVPVHLGSPVVRIDPLDDGVHVTTTSGGFRAAHAIVTLPLGVLKSGTVEFGAELDPARRRAIDALGVGLLNKCVLRFEKAFWPVDVDWIDYLGPTENLWGDWTSYLSATGVPYLAAFNASRVADEVEAWDDRTTTQSALDALRAMFGSAVPDPLGSQISRWRKDPFARGAYSFLAVGSTSDDRKSLFGSDWDRRLFFAGEATSHECAATVHGALITGRAAAASILGTRAHS